MKPVSKLCVKLLQKATEMLNCPQFWVVMMRVRSVSTAVPNIITEGHTFLKACYLEGSQVIEHESCNCVFFSHSSLQGYIKVKSYISRQSWPG